MTIDAFSELLKVFLQLANVVVLGYALYKFMKTPHNTLEKRVTELEVKVEEHGRALKQGNDRFRHDNSTMEVIQICMLAIIDFELTFCAQTGFTQTEDLIKAKNLLREHLAKKED